MSARQPATGRGGHHCNSCTNITIMQLFHELKQQFPAVPDEVVNACINDYCHDKPACRARLQRESEQLPRLLAYPSTLMGAPYRSGPTVDQPHQQRTDADGSDITEMNENLNPILNQHHRPVRAQQTIYNNQDVKSVNRTDFDDIYSSNYQRNCELFTPPPDRSDLPSPFNSPKQTTSPFSSSPIFQNPFNSPRVQIQDSSRRSTEELTSTFAQISTESSTRTEFLQTCLTSGQHCDSPPRTPRLERKPPISSYPSNPQQNCDSPTKTLQRPETLGKPPISPCSSNRRFGPTKNSPTKSRLFDEPSRGATDTGAIKKSTPIRPATLDLPESNTVNLSINCSVDVSPTRPQKHSTVLQVTPEPAWIHHQPENKSPRSYTSVNLTLRTPTSDPQPPIDICSANSSLTYTTSSFDSRQGLQSQLMITVGPGGVGSVSAVRSRPRSLYQQVDTPKEEAVPVRGNSLPDLLATRGTTSHILLVSRQLARKEQLKNELDAGKERLSAIRKEVQSLQLENTPTYRDHLRKQIRHLQSQCERLTQEVDRHSESRLPLGETNEEFYRHIYTGQRGSLRSRHSQQRPMLRTRHTATEDESRWPCHICTFRNHPLMDKCEQCEMPRILLGKLATDLTTTPSNQPHASNSSPQPVALGMNI